MEPTYHLEGIIRSKEEMEDFEGPLNLILMLLSKNKIEIRDIKISVILEQYLLFLDEMEAMDLEIASEFVQMASHLLYIKTKMLLNTKEEVSELELLMASLEQLKARDAYASIRENLPYFAEAAERGFQFRTKPPEIIDGVEHDSMHHSLEDLLSGLFRSVTRVGLQIENEVSETELRRRILPHRAGYNVQDKSIEIMQRLREIKTINLSMLYSESQSRSEVVATFISTLELCSLGSITLTAQDGDIVLTFVCDAEELLATRQKKAEADLELEG